MEYLKEFGGLIDMDDFVNFILSSSYTFDMTSVVRVFGCAIFIELIGIFGRCFNTSRF